MKNAVIYTGGTSECQNLNFLTEFLIFPVLVIDKVTEKRKHEDTIV